MIPLGFLTKVLFNFCGVWCLSLPVAATPYLSACEENIQCSARMGQGAICSAGICVCEDGFHYLHGICHKSSGKCPGKANLSLYKHCELVVEVQFHALFIFGTRWMWVVILTFWPLYPRGNSIRYPLDGRLGRPENMSGRDDE